LLQQARHQLSNQARLSAVWSVLSVAVRQMHSQPCSQLFTVWAWWQPQHYADADDDDADMATQRRSDAARADAPATECMPVVHNLFDWLQSAFVDTY